MITVLQRAFSSNLKKVSARPAEQALLESRGIHDSSLQTYFVWRRSLMVFIIIATFLSCALSTYRENFEDDDRPGAFETIVAKVTEQITAASKTALPAALPAVPSQVDTVTEKVKDAADAALDESEDPPAEKHAASGSTKPKKSALGQLDDLVHLISLYSLPITALVVILNWTRFGFTFKLLAGTFIFSFVMPILLSFCPWSWWEPENAIAASEMTNVDQDASAWQPMVWSKG